MVSVWGSVITVVIVLVVVIVAIIIAAFVTRSSRRIRVEPNSPFLLVDPSRTCFTGGHAMLLLIKKPEINKNGTLFFEGYPVDERQGRTIENPKLESLVVAKEFIDNNPILDWSTSRQIIETIPRSKADLPHHKRKTLTGDYLGKKGSQAFAEMMGSEEIRQGDEAIAASIAFHNRGNISKPTLEVMKSDKKSLKDLEDATTQKPDK